jgi:CIC family chloride channel protein
MVFELSASYVIILPVMVANLVAYLVARKLQPVTFFDMVAAQDGLQLPSQERQREQRPLRVEDAMQMTPAADTVEQRELVLYPDESLDRALRLFQSHDALLVVSRQDSRRVLGVLTVGDTLRAYGIRRSNSAERTSDVPTPQSAPAEPK